MKRIIFILLTISSIHAYSQTPDIRQQILNFAEENSTTGYKILSEVKDWDFEKYLHGNTQQENIPKTFGTCVHESLHMYNSRLADIYYKSGEYQKSTLFKEYQKYEKQNRITIIRKRSYFIYPDIIVNVPCAKVFNSKELKKFVSKDTRKKIHRWNTYIGDASASASKTEGIFGIMEEFDGYYHGTKADYELYDYYFKLSDGFKNENRSKQVYQYITGVEGTHYAYYEFELFISWYMQFAKKYHPEDYEKIMMNKALRVAYSLISSEYEKLVNDYFKKRDELMEIISTDKQKSYIDAENYFFVPDLVENSKVKFKVRDENVNYLKSLLSQSENQKMLEEFKIQGVTKENYKSFLE